MKKVLFILLGTVLLLTGALTFRTIRFVSRQIEVPPEKMIRLDTQSIVGRLARAIQYRTISGKIPRIRPAESFSPFTGSWMNHFRELINTCRKKQSAATAF